MKFIRGQVPSSGQGLTRSHSLHSTSSLPFLPLVRNKWFPGKSTTPEPSTQLKEPLLCLTLSTPSFLDCTVVDVAKNCPLYRIKTSGPTTTISRGESSVVASSIKWPKIIPLTRTKARSELVTVIMKDGPWDGGGSLLKPQPKESSRKFHLPNYHDPLKWKLHGCKYQCTTPNFGTIAALDPRRGPHPPKLTVFEDLYNPHQSFYGSVSTMLLDYLVVSALLLVTDPHEWALRKNDECELPCPDSEVRSMPTSHPQEEPSDSMGRHRSHHSSQSSSSMASTIGTVPPSQNATVIQASYSSHNFYKSLWLDADSAVSEIEEHESRREWKRPFFRPVSETYSAAVESDSSHTQGPLPSPRFHSHWDHTLPRSASGNIRELRQPSHALMSASSRHPDGTVSPNLLQASQMPGSEHEQNPYNLITRPRRTSIAHDMGNTRPLPLPPTVYGSSKSPSGPSRSHELGEPSLPALGRDLPPRPGPVVPGLHTTAVDHALPSSMDDPSCPTGDVHSQQHLNTKTLRWLDASSFTPEFLLRASAYGTPPPAYYA